MIIVAITGPAMTHALEQIRSSRRWADAFELRLDLIENPDIRVLLRASRKPAVVTLRPAWEGGFFKGSEAERREILLDAVRAGAAFADLELAAGSDFRRAVKSARKGVQVILSKHVAGGEGDWRKEYRKFSGTGADVIKWVLPAGDVGDALPAIHFLRQAKKERRRAIAMTMGEAGEFSRILYRKFGGWATYAAPETGSPSAPGQLRGSVMKSVFRADRITPSTRVYGVLGNPLTQSRGVFVHNALFAARGINAVYVQFPARDLARFFSGVMPLVDGCSVTLPFKEEVGKYCDAVDPSAIRAGAANTLYRRKKRLHAANADGMAALDSIEQRIKVRGKRILVIGAGGTARAVVSEAVHRGARVVVANRSFERASRIAAGSGAAVVRMDELQDAKYDVLVNTTSVGMVPHVDAMPVPSSLLRPSAVVFDAVYNPPVTRLLREAKGAGARTISGIEMFILQGAAQFTLFTGKRADLRLMRRTLKRALAS